MSNSKQASMLALFETDAGKQKFMAQFAGKFRQSPDPDDSSFLSISYRRDEKGTHLNVPKLWKTLENLLHGTDLPRALGSPLPADALKLLCQPEDPITNPLIPEDECDVRAILGTAMWGVLAVRPAECFAAAAIARHVHRPTRNVVNILLGFCSYFYAHR